MMDNSQTVPKLTLQRRIESMDLVFMAAGRQECKPSDSSGPRTCSYHMLHFVLKGKVHFYLGGQHYIVNAGQCFYVPEGTNTFYYSDPTNPCIYAWLNFTGDDAVEIVRECGMSNVCPTIALPDVKHIWDLIGGLLHCYGQTPANDIAIRGFMHLIFATLMRNPNVSSIAQEARDSSSENDLIKRAVAYVQEHADKTLSVQMIAAHCFISRGYLCQLFIKYLHTTPQQFVINSKVQKASELLTKTRMPIARIAELCGYRNQFSFSRAFARELTLSPSEYRRRFSNPDRLVTE